MDFIFNCPVYFQNLIDRLIERNWLVHNFPSVENEELYNFANYKENKISHDVSYTIYLDLNIYQYILNSVKKNVVKEEYKDAIALVAFCQVAEIELDPMYAVYEKVNYRTDKTLLDEITGDLELFHKINNATNECLGRYVLGFESYLKLENEYKINHDEVQSKLIKHRRLTEWDSLYLIVLFITHVSLNKALSNREKLRTVVEWLITDFRLSLVAITYVSVYFGKMPLKNMMKFKESQSPEYKLNNLFNMTWDLYNLNRFFRMWTNRDPTKEEMFASGDKAFNAILRNSINVQNKGDLSAFEIFLPQDEVNYLEKITANPNLYFERAYNSDQWTIDYRTTLINKYESTLGVSSSET